MKSQQILTLSVLVVSSFLWSCSKRDGNHRTDDPNNLLITEARTYFEKNVLPLHQPQGPSTETNRHSFNKNPDWLRAKVQDFRFGRSVVVPLETENMYISKDGGRTKQPFSGTTYLLVYRDSANAQHAEVVVKLPDERSIPKSYSGVVMVEDWTGKLLKSYHYKDNREYQVNTTISYRQRRVHTETEFICYDTDFYTCVSVGGTNYGCSYNYTTTTCSGTGGSGDGGGGGGSDPGGGGGGSDPGGGSGGGAGGGYGGVGGTSTVSSIKDQLTRPCSKTALKTAIDGRLQNWLTSTICNMFEASDKLEMVIRDTVLQGNSSTEASTTAYGNSYFLTVEIALNTYALQNASKEYVVATIYHEFVHAYMRAKGTKPMMDHNEMGIFYVDIMVMALKEAFPGMAPTQARALAWVGAEESYTWTLLWRDDNEYARSLQSTARKHKAGTLGTPCN